MTLAVSSDVHTLIVQIVAGLTVVALGGTLAVGMKTLQGQKRVHDAIFGWSEGQRQEKGIVDIVMGNGHGSLLDLATRAEQTALDNGRRLSDHISQVESEKIEMHAVLAGLVAGQQSAAQTADAVSVELHAPFPATRSIPVEVEEVVIVPVDLPKKSAAKRVRKSVK